MTPLREVERAIQSKVTQECVSRRVHLTNYFSTDLKVFGLRTPEQRTIAKLGFSWSTQTNEGQLQRWNKVWLLGDAMETLSQPLFWLETIKDMDELMRYWPVLRKWVNRVDNWAHSDQLSAQYSRMLEHRPDVLYPVMVQWNHSLHPWKRRQSLVSLLFYARLRRNVLPPEKILALVQQRLADPHFFVQRAVGWCLRECWNIYPQETYHFLETYANRMSAIAFATASEKIDAQKRARLKIVRKEARQKQKSRVV